MRYNLFRGVIAIVLLCNSLTLHASKTPLSEYSSQWDFEYFNKANTISLSSYLSPSEKDFVYILNLARVSPILFMQSVLIPYFNKHGYSELAYESVNSLKYAGNLPMILPSNYYKKQVKTILESSNINKYCGEGNSNRLILQNESSAYIFSKSGNAIDIIIQLLTNEGNSGVIFRKYFSGNYTDAGILISPHAYQGFVTSVICKNISQEQRKKLPKIVDIDKNNFDPPRMVIYNHYPNDSILQFFLRIAESETIGNTKNNQKIKIVNKNSQFIDREGLEKLYDSLNENSISFSKSDYMFYVNKKNTQELRKLKVISKNAYSYITSYFSINSNFNESEKPLDLYFIGRTEDSPDNEIRVNLLHLTSPPPQPLFPSDSIGTFEYPFDLSHVDDYVNTLGKIDDSKLAYTLTSHFKTELEKVRAIFIWLVKNISYDYEGLGTGKFTYEIKDVLSKRVAVCAGYANLFSYLCKQANIRCEYISGKTHRDLHAWNAVNINNKWYLLDATWGPKYFLMRPEVFVQDHFSFIKKWSLLTKTDTYEEWKEKYKKNTN